MPIDGQVVVNQLFWANYAGEKIYTSFESRAKAVDNLQKFIVWLFSLFTSGGLILTFFGRGEFNAIALSLFAVGFVALIVGYFLATKCGFPFTEKINPNEAQSVQDAFQKAITQSNKYFQYASGWVTCGVFVLALGMLAEFAFGQSISPTPPPKPPGKLQLNAYLKQNGSDTLLPFIVHGEGNSVISVNINAVDSFVPGINYPVNGSTLFAGSLPTDTAGFCMSVLVLPKNMQKTHFIITATSGQQNADSTYSVIVKKLLLSN